MAVHKRSGFNLKGIVQCKMLMYMCILTGTYIWQGHYKALIRGFIWVMVFVANALHQCTVWLVQCILPYLGAYTCIQGYTHGFTIESVLDLLHTIPCRACQPCLPAPAQSYEPSHSILTYAGLEDSLFSSSRGVKKSRSKSKSKWSNITHSNAVLLRNTVHMYIELCN